MDAETLIDTPLSHTAANLPEGQQHDLIPHSAADQEDGFSYEGYQVVRGEFFAHTHEPAITFNNYKVSVNTACVKKLPDVEYVQILVNPEEQKLAVRPCHEDEKDSFLWCSAGSIARKPKQITCRVFFAKIMELMSWNSDYRYKLLGKLIHSRDEYLSIFDLTSPEIYHRVAKTGDAMIRSRAPVFPAEWQNQFGLPVEEHRKALQINIFNGYAVFGIQDSIGKSGQCSESTTQSMEEAENHA